MLYIANKSEAKPRFCERWRAAAPGHTLKWQEKCFSTPLRNAFYLITILLTIKNNLVK